MSSASDNVWKLRTVARLRKAWQLGGPIEKSFAVAIAAEPMVGLLIVILGIPFLSQQTPSEIGQLLLVGLMAILGQPAFLNAQYAGALGLAFWQAALDHGWMPSFERAYYGELVRYMRAHAAKTGLLPGDAAWASAYCLLYFGTIVGAEAVVVLGWPLIGPWTFIAFAAIEIPVAVLCFRVFGRRTRRRFRDAAEAGYQLSALLVQTNRRILEQRRLSTVGRRGR